MKKINKAFCFLSAVLLCTAASVTHAQTTDSSAADVQSFPDRPIRIIVPFTPGAFNDTFARSTGQHLSKALKQPVIVENRGGAGAVIGTDLVAKAPADGYTILQVPANHSINTTLNRRLPYHSTNDFTFLTLVATSPFVLVVNPSVPVNSVKELIALTKANPGKYTYASTGSGGNAHLMGEMLKTIAKIDVLHVPYRGASPALTDVMAGQVDMIFMSYAGAASAIKSGRVRAIGVTSKERWSVLPDLPTIQESGVPGYEAIAWWGFAAPAGTPPAIAQKLRDELNKVARSEEMRAQYEPEGLIMMGTTEEEFAKFVEVDTQKWAKIIKESGIVSD